MLFYHNMPDLAQVSLLVQIKNTCINHDNCLGQFSSYEACLTAKLGEIEVLLYEVLYHFSCRI